MLSFGGGVLVKIDADRDPLDYAFQQSFSGVQVRGAGPLRSRFSKLRALDTGSCGIRPVARRF